MSSGPEKYLKITYHASGALKPLNAYLKMPSPTFSVLKREISMFLFEERSQPRCELRTYWIDEDHDEIEMSNQCDYDIFRAKRSERQHLQVAPLKESANTPDDPSVFVIHDRVECDECNAAPIVGFRYKCIQCPNYDLCQKCEAQHKHAEHMMVRMPTDNCPSVIEAWVSGRSSGRRNSKRSKANYCPFVNSTTANKPMAGGAAGFCGTVPQATGEAQPETKDHHHHHHGRKHHRRQMRQGIFSTIYDIMQDLAEGGPAETATKDEEVPAADKAGASGAQKAAEGSAKATQEAASKVAHDLKANVAHEAGRAAHYAATKAAEAAVKAAHEAATLAGQNLPTACPFGFTPPHGAATLTAQNLASGCPFGFKLPTAAEPTEKEAKVDSSAAPKTPPPTPDTTAPNAAEPEIKKTTEPMANAVPTHPLLNSSSLENLAQYVDPQYMKAGIQILNNFSEMFAKMLDPMDDASTPVQSPFQSAAFQARKNSTSSTASNLSSGSTTSSSKKTTVEKPLNENINETNVVEQDAAAAAAPENIMTEPLKDATPTPAARMAAENVSQLPERRRSQSGEDSEWQLISPNGSFDTVSPSTSTESVDGIAAGASAVVAPTTSAAPSTPIVTGINYEQLSKDLKAHVEQEQKREQELKDQQAATTAAAAAVTATAPVAPAVEATEERRAIAVYHADRNINNAVHIMIGMGFSNEGAWLTQLLESVNGNIPEALDLMSAAQRSNN